MSCGRSLPGRVNILRLVSQTCSGGKNDTFDCVRLRLHKLLLHPFICPRWKLFGLNVGPQVAKWVEASFSHITPICDEADTSQASRCSKTTVSSDDHVMPGYGHLHPPRISDAILNIILNFPTLVFQPAEIPEREPSKKAGMVLNTKPK